MTVYQGYKVKIHPTKEQELNIQRAFNAKIKAYNWGLETQLKRDYDKGYKLLNRKELMAEFRYVIANDIEYQWLNEFSKHMYYFAFDDLNNTIFKWLKEGHGKPKFKSVKDQRKSLSQRNDMRLIKNSKAQIAKIGLVDLAEPDRIPVVDNKEYKGIRFSYDGINYWLSVNIPMEVETNKLTDNVIGIDLGIRVLATLSDGTTLPFPSDLIKVYTRRLTILNRRLQKATNGSKNKKKLIDDIKKVNLKIDGVLSNHIHQFTAEIIKKKPKAIVMEDLSVSTMMKNKYVASSLQHAKFRYFRDVLQYKCERSGIEFVLANRYYPSSKICSSCGNKKRILHPYETFYDCNECDLTLDRDYNASINLRNYYFKT